MSSGADDLGWKVVVYIVVAASFALVALLVLSLFFSPFVTALGVAWNLVLAAAFFAGGLGFLKRRRWAVTVTCTAAFLFYLPSLMSYFQGLGWQSRGYIPSALVLAIVLCVFSLPEGVLKDWSKAYDPSWLVTAAREQAPEEPWLPEALAQCTRCLSESDRYVRFVDPRRPNQPGSEWQFERNVFLETSTHGLVALDVLTDNRIGGVEFHDRL